MISKLIALASCATFAHGGPVNFAALNECKAADTQPIFCDPATSPCDKSGIDHFCGNGWEKQTFKHCASDRFSETYSTQAQAQDACDRKGSSECQGVYDVSCNGTGSWYLCKNNKALAKSSSSCVYKPPNRANIACCAIGANCADTNTAEVRCSTVANQPAKVIWDKVTLSHCAGYKVANHYYQSLQEAQNACANLGTQTCTAVYDPSCNDSGTFYLCQPKSTPWSRSSSSCVYTPPVTPPPSPAPPTAAPTPPKPPYAAEDLPMCTVDQKQNGHFVCGGENYYDCTQQLIEAYCVTMTNACCGDTDDSCEDGDDSVFCLAEQTPSPTPAPAFVTVPTTVTGYTAAEFTTVLPGSTLTPLDAYRTAFAAKTQAPLAYTQIINLMDVTRRRLGGARQLSSASVSFDVEVMAPSESKAENIKAIVETTTNADMLKEYKDTVTNAGGTTPSGLSVGTSQNPANPIIAPPFYTPPAEAAPTPVPGTYEPSATVKKLHGYMVASGGISADVWDPKRTGDGSVKVTGVAIASGCVVLVLYLLFVFCQCFCKPVKCCYKKSLDPDHTTRAKVVQTFLFLIFGGLMLATVKGRDSWHQATDIVADTLSDTSDLFTQMETASIDMNTQSIQFNTALMGLTGGCDADSCDACRYSGQTGTDKATWEQAARDNFMGAGDNAGVAEKIGAFIDQFKNGATQLKTRLGGTAQQLREISEAVGDDGKTWVDIILVAMLVPGVLVLVIGLLGTWCLHAKKTSKGCCSTSTFLMFFAQIFGALYVIMLIIFVAFGAGGSVLFAEVCNQPVPETALIEVLQEDNMATGKPLLKPEDFDVPTLDYYLTCPPGAPNKLEDQVRLAGAGVRQLGDELKKTGNDDCDFSPLNAVVPDATRAVGAVQAAVTCPNINALLLRFTREGVCTHMVDGMYFLWTVQAACGVFLIFALVMMRLVQQTFHNQPKEQPPTPTPVAQAAQQQIGSVQVFQQQNAQNTV